MIYALLGLIWTIIVFAWGYWLGKYDGASESRTAVKALEAIDNELARRVRRNLRLVKKDED